MRWLAIFENNTYSNIDSQKLKSLLRSNGVQANDVRVGKFVEVDYFSDSLLGEKIGELLKLKKVEECELEKCNKNLQELVKNGRCWEAHELLEELWHKAEGSKKEEIHKIIKVCVAVVHYQRGNFETAKRIMHEALQGGINVELTESLEIGFLAKKLKEGEETAIGEIAFGA